MRLALLYISFWLSITCYAQEAPTEAPPPPMDSIVSTVKEASNDTNSISTDSLLNRNYTTDNELNHRAFEPNFQQKYQGEEYDYTKTKARRSLWDRFMDYIKETISSWLGYDEIKHINKFTKNIGYILAAVVIALLIFFLFKYGRDKEGNWFFSKKVKNINPKVNPLEENIHEINFQQTIAQYEREKDFRSAIRYQFLWCLKFLSDHQKIDWHQKKTNSDYLKELKGKDLVNFEKAVYIFDHIWYGEFPIDEAKYQQQLPIFQPLKSVENE